MPSKKQSRNNKKSSSQVAKPMANATTIENDSDDGFGSMAILMNSGKSSRSSTQSNKSKKSVEPLVVPVPEWEQVGMTKEDYEALCEKVKKQIVDSEVESMKQNMIADLDSISYWQSRIEKLEKMREPYNKKAAWTAEMLEQLEEVDFEIQECLEEIHRINQNEKEEEEEEEYERCNGCGRWEPVGQMDHAAGYGRYCSRDCGPSGYGRD